MLSIQDKIQQRPAIQLFVISFVSILIIVTIQDVFHARRNQYDFYLSESILFNSYWLWFFPVTVLARMFYKSKKIRTRIILFTLSASALHALIYALTVFGVSYIFYEATYDIPKMLGYTASHDFYKYIFGYSLMGIFSFQANNTRQKESPLPVESKDRDQKIRIITVSNGRNKIFVPLEDIIVIRSSSPYIALHTLKKVHLHSATLKSILKQLPPGLFVQVHKSAIINIQEVASYRSRLNGDYDIILNDGQEVRLSRNYAPHFKELFDTDSSS